MSFGGDFHIINTTFLNNGKDYLDVPLQPLNAPLVIWCTTYYSTCSVVVLDCVFKDNQGGITMSASNADAEHSLVVNGCLFKNTWAMSSGGALYIDAIKSVLISNSSFHDHNAWLAYGGAIYVRQGSGSVQVCA